MHDSTEGKILGFVSLIGTLAILGGIYWLTKNGNSDLDLKCLEENRRIAKDASFSPEAKIKLKDCRKQK